jgi:ribosome-binding protein aMBF1 (putative translation factor)
MLEIARVIAPGGRLVIRQATRDIIDSYLYQRFFPEARSLGNYAAVETVRAIYARRLILERESAGLSQSELARRAGLRPETINRLEKAKHSPDTATLAKITKALRAAGIKA